MGKRGLFFRLYSYCLLISLSCLLGVLLFASTSFRNYSHDRSRQHLAGAIQLVANDALVALRNSDRDGLRRLTQRFFEHVQAPLDIVDGDGRVLASSRPLDTQDLSGTNEVLQALGGEPAEWIYYDSDLGREVAVLAVPIKDGDVILGALRSTRPLVTRLEILLRSLGGVIGVGLALLALVAVLSWRIVRRVSLPLDQMRSQAEQIAHGNFDVRAEFGPHDFIEVQRLGVAINEIAVELGSRMQTIVAQKNEQDAVFSSMTEGVIAIDLDERIMHLNQAAARILDISVSMAVGRSLPEVIRIPEIHDFVKGSLSRDEPVEQDVELRRKSEQVLQLRSSPLRNARQWRIGTVLVINDITQLRKLESHRRDFVANVSHELRTPLTSIQGFAETLMNPNVTDPAEIRKFLEIIHRHAARLGAIIEDLLALSRIEREVEENSIELATGALRPSVVAAVEVCEVKARERNVRVGYQCPEEIRTRINPPLLEQAIINLIDNAIKYSEPGGRVDIEVRKEPLEVVISVIDQGPGIPKQHLPRLFERFYRVDKARSRKDGGTGLGLSIVKHVSLAHRGRLEVESEIGRGSKFSIHLPA